MILYPIKVPEQTLSESQLNTYQSHKDDFEQVQQRLKNIIEIDQLEVEIDETLLNDANNNCVKLYHEGKFREALSVANTLNQILSRLNNPSLTFRAVLYNNLGIFYDSLGNLKNAIYYLENSLGLKKDLPFGEFSILMTKNNLILSYLNEGRLKEAHDQMKNILEKIKKDSKEESILYNTMGIIYFYKGQYIEAMECFQKASQGFSIFEPENTFLKATVKGNIASTCCDLGKYQKAMSLHEEVLKSIESSRPDHPFLAFCYNNIGFICKFLGHLLKALEHILKAYTILKHEFEEDHPDIARILNNIGIIYLKRANYDQALDYITQALKIGIKCYGKEHLEIAKYQNNIGLIFDQRGMKNDAIKHYEQALELYIKFFGENHPHVAVIYDNIGCVIADLGNYREGLIKYLRSLRIRIKTLRENDAYMASTFYDIGCLFREQKIFHWGINFYKKAYVCDLKNLGRTHFDTNLSEGNIKDLCVHNELNQDPIYQDLNKMI